ncbi:MAG: hypothetical protein WC373_14695 [Smithella sp.]|jgi:hypothetical protein
MTTTERASIKREFDKAIARLDRRKSKLTTANCMVEIFNLKTFIINLEIENQQGWCVTFVKTLMDGGLSSIEAYDTLHAMDNIPYKDDPVDCANEELSNYGD